MQKNDNIVLFFSKGETKTFFTFFCFLCTSKSIISIFVI